MALNSFSIDIKEIGWNANTLNLTSDGIAHLTNCVKQWAIEENSIGTIWDFPEDHLPELNHEVSKYCDPDVFLDLVMV